MPSNLDLLREGKAVEFEPGLSGRLNKEKKTLELSNGRILNVAHDTDYFPRDEQQLNLSRQKEDVEKKAKGPVGEFLHQYTSKGIPGGFGDWRSFLSQTPEEYTTRKHAENQVSQRISQESPYISAGATAANIATDIALTRGMSGVQAAPLLTLGSAGSRLVTEPQEVLGETAVSALAGKGLDITGNYFQRVANRRGLAREIPIQQQNVRNSNIAGQQAVNEANIAGKQAVNEANIAGKQAVNEANELQTEKFNFLKQNVKNTNESRLKQFEDDLNIRKNKILQEENAYEQRRFQRDAEIVRLKNKAETDKIERSATKAQSDAEYQTKKQAADLENKRMDEKFKQDNINYQEDLKKLPEMQKQAQQEYSENVIRNAEGISKAFPKKSRIDSSELGVNEFIEQSLQKSGRAASRESNQATKILKAIIPDGEILTGRELSTRYRALEGAIQKATPEVREILNEFKTHMGEKIPNILSNNLAYNRTIPFLKTQIEREVNGILDKMQLTTVGSSSRTFIKNRANSSLNQIFREITPQDFVNKMQNGEIKEKILKNILRYEDFAGGVSQVKPVTSRTMKLTTSELERRGIAPPNPLEEKYKEFLYLFKSKLDNAVAKAELKMVATEMDAAKKIGPKIKRTYGYAENINPPNPPISPSNVPYPETPPPIPPGEAFTLPPPVTPPGSPPPFPQKPSLVSPPTAPTSQNFVPENFNPQGFTPQAEPMLPPARGFAEQSGDFLEKNLFGGKTLTDNPITKLAGLKYVLGKGALPLEAAYAGMKGLTSPTAAGEAARMTFKQAGIQAIVSWAEKYPSYNNGILQDPQERRSLTKEIEDDFDIPIEQKAIMQSKVNRGIPLQQRL
jgi:hypothetical protein